MYQHAVCVKYNSDIKFHSTHSLYDSNNHDYDMGCRIVAVGTLWSHFLLTRLDTVGFGLVRNDVAC